VSTGAVSVPVSGEHGPPDGEPRRRDRRRAPALAFAIALLVPAIGVIAALSQPGERLAGTNNVFERFANVALVEGTTACERGEVVPAQTGAVRLSTQTGGRPGPALSVRIVESGGRIVSRGALASGWTGAHADVPVATVGTTLVDAQVCVTSAGPGEVRLLGYGGEDGVLLDGRATGETIQRGLRDLLDAKGLAYVITGHPTMFGIMFTESVPSEYRDWAATDHELYDAIAAGMLQRGAMPEPDSREPWFICESHAQGDLVDRVIVAFGDSLDAALDERPRGRDAEGPQGAMAHGGGG